MDPPSGSAARSVSLVRAIDKEAKSESNGVVSLMLRGAWSDTTQLSCGCLPGGFPVCSQCRDIAGVGFGYPWRHVRHGMCSNHGRVAGTRDRRPLTEPCGGTMASTETFMTQHQETDVPSLRPTSLQPCRTGGRRTQWLASFRHIRDSHPKEQELPSCRGTQPVYRGQKGASKAARRTSRMSDHLAPKKRVADSWRARRAE